jgi:MYXO-CTERM domain-containing protein
MRALAVGLCVVLAPSAARAACSGAGQTWSCPAGATTADVSDAITGADDGATITFANGAYTLDGLADFSTTKGATLLCASVGGCTIATTSTVFGFTGWSSGVFDHLYRISGFVFNATGQATIWWGTSCNPCNDGTFTQIRIDHNTFNLTPGSVAVLLDGNANVGNAFYGVVDHNKVASTEQAGIFQWIGAIGNPTAPASQLGTGNNMFIEDNALDFPSVGNASALGCMDAWGAMAGLVVRHNTSRNCLWTVHGVTHGGGPSNVEFYANTVVMDSGATSAGVDDGYRSFHHQGSGTFVAFDNSFSAFNGKNAEVISVAHYRDFANSVDNGLPICDGTQTSPPDGNRAPTATWQGYPCWNQPGRDAATLAYKPMYVWNNYWADTKAEIPLVSPDFGGSPDYHAIHMAENREWYNAVAASPQASPSAPFDGTTGMGFGTLADRPTTCTTSTETAFGNGAAGVGYFAKDVGPQGTLYTCSATNTWTTYYTPFTYPHPLVGGAPPEDGGVGDGGAGDGGVTTGSSSGCGCRTAPSTSPSLAGLAALVALALARRRRR